jgi:ATP-dependent helicase HrpB
MLEPRRLAARSAAERMAELLGEPVGATVGYRVRGENRISDRTRIEVVTEGILTRMIQADPGLDGIGLVIFDEFHERSLHADFGLALAWEVRGALRNDLKVLVMSATIDAEPVAAMLDNAPVVRSEGRAFPVETRWLARAPADSQRFEAAAAGLIRQAVEETTGGLLAFLPGEAEIMRVAGLLRGGLPDACDVVPLFGAMEFAAQRDAIRPAPAGRRKVVLATSIAETSLTIPDIRVVVDGGRARRARFDAGSGMSRLVTERVTRAEADQRRGRAGRVAAGVCYRLWTKGEEGGLAPFAPPEIISGDLTGLALELALWGARAGELAFLTPPSPAALAEAQSLLAGLGAVDEAGHITPHGRRMAALPLHPRIAHMLLVAGRQAATLAALLEERDPLRGATADLTLRLDALRDPAAFERNTPLTVNRTTVDRIRTEARRLARLVDDAPAPLVPSEMAALAYPDRIGLKREGGDGRFVLSGGKGAVVDTGDPLSRERLIVATDLDGDPREARVRQGIALNEAAMRRLCADRITKGEVVEWSRRDGRVVARTQERLGALVLADAPLARPSPEAVALSAIEGLRAIGLPMTDAAGRLRARIDLLRQQGAALPDVSDEALLADTGWLLPCLAGRRTEADLRVLDLTEALRSRLSWEERQLLDRLAPATFVTPLGRHVPIDYGGENPSIEVRLQEMFGVTVHPAVGPKRLPLRITLLSPARRPIQVTMDLPGFWRSSYADVRKDMRGQYPRHPWPEDPTLAEPTLRAKPRTH